MPAATLTAHDHLMDAVALEKAGDLGGAAKSLARALPLMAAQAKLFSREAAQVEQAAITITLAFGEEP